MNQEVWIYSNENPGDKLIGAGVPAPVHNMFTDIREMLEKFPGHYERELQLQEYLNTQNR